jgi:hypothetical protein
MAGRSEDPNESKNGRMAARRPEGPYGSEFVTDPFGHRGGLRAVGCGAESAGLRMKAGAPGGDGAAVDEQVCADIFKNNCIRPAAPRSGRRHPCSFLMAVEGKKISIRPLVQHAAGGVHRPAGHPGFRPPVESVMVLPQPGSPRDTAASRPAHAGPDSQNNTLADPAAARGGACARIQITTGRICRLPAGHQGECRFTEPPQEPGPHNGSDACPAPQAWTEGDAGPADRTW